MKRICAIILCLCLVLSGCQGNKTKDDANETITNNTDNEQENNTGEVTLAPTPVEEDATEEGFLYLDAEWTSVETAKPVKATFAKPFYEAESAGYKIEKDLSNIENIDQFTGFTKDQIKKLINNGFVVLPTQTTKMYYTYDSNEYTGVPNFITSDSVLHLYHQFYDKSLINVETAYLYKDLELMTKQMLDKSLVLLNALEDDELKELQKKNVIYFLTARMLMLRSTEIPITIDEELLTLAKNEYALCNKAEGIAKSPLLNKDVDYSQFTVRGHYTRTEELGRFFRTMMWFGTVPYAFYSGDVYQYEKVLQALLISYMTFAKSEEISDAKLWSNIYLPTSQYVGLSDDIDVFTMNKLRKEVFGDQENPNRFNDEEYYSKLEAAVRELPEPQIQGKVILSSLDTEKQFRFMGQRYILDSDILQDLITPILRPIPSGLDVMGVLGSDLAEQLQFEVYKPQDKWEDYTEHYKEWKEKVAGYGSDYWSTNLYTGWLWTLQDALKEYDSNSGMPFFMTTQAWKNKALSTALGSYTELKHDTVLYGKQAMAEMGGPVEFADYHYVEPQVELYAKLYYLTDYTITTLKDRGMLNESLLNGANEYKELLQFLMNCSIKELRNEPLSKEENDSLLRYGGSLENISNSFLKGIVDEDYPNIEISDMLVSDVSSADGSYLSLGTGYFDQIYVIAPMNGKLYLCRGSVYSHYEFVSNERLTDEEWWELNGIKIIHEDYADYPEISEPSDQRPAQPEWINTFKSDTN
ncbi:MAG: hypothetical protein K0R34_2912, partial [Herbinix sp.]|nr:hypothetical protein [Herbinix sp.]